MAAHSVLWALAVGAVAAAPVDQRPKLSTSRSLEFASFVGGGVVEGCDSNIIGLTIVHGAPFASIICEDGVLYIDGVAAPSATHVGKTGIVGFYHGLSGAHMVLQELPGSSRRNSVGTASLVLGGQTKLVLLSEPPLLYDIFEDTAEGKFWYTLAINSRVGAAGLEITYTLFEEGSSEDEVGFDLTNATFIYNPTKSPNQFNISFNRNWPDSGNGEYIAADLTLFDGWNINTNITGVAFKYNATVCACNWNGTGCANVCPGNSTNLGFRGDQVRLRGALRALRSPARLEVGTPAGARKLTHGQLNKLHETYRIGESLVQAGVVDSRGADFLSGTCDESSATALIRGIVSLDGQMSSDFWGTHCDTQVGDKAPPWEQLAQNLMTKVMLWWLQQPGHNDNICTVAEQCTFCSSKQSEIDKCPKSPDGTASPASKTNIFGLYTMEGQHPYKPCSACGDSTSCLDECIPEEIIEAINTGPNATEINIFLQNLSYATISLQYASVPKGSGEMDHGRYKEFNDMMWHTWDEGGKVNGEDSHSVHLDKLELFFQHGISNSPGYQVLGQIVNRYALMSQLAEQLKLDGAIPPALRGNPCLQAGTGIHGVELLDSPKGPVFAKAFY